MICTLFTWSTLDWLRNKIKSAVCLLMIPAIRWWGLPFMLALMLICLAKITTRKMILNQWCTYYVTWVLANYHGKTVNQMIKALIKWWKWKLRHLLMIYSKAIPSNTPRFLIILKINHPRHYVNIHISIACLG